MRCHPFSCANFRLVPTRRAALLAVTLFGAVSIGAPPQKTKNIIFVMTDGLRWQDLFNGAEESLITKENGVSDVPGLRKVYWRDTSEPPRAVLIPFMCGVIAKRAQASGNRNLDPAPSATTALSFAI